MANHKNHLNHSYQLNSVNDTQVFYSDWAKTYDAEIIDNGYASPRRCAEALAVHTNNKSLNILDIGCGTGLSGKVLTEHGFSNISGCDINPEMLAIAETRELYKELWLSDIENPFPFESGTYDAITAIGVIGAGAAPVDVFYSAIDKLTKNGLFVFSFNDHTLENPAYEAAIEEQLASNNYKLIFSEFGDHLPGKNINSKVYILLKR